jgi:hypothetical protein
MSRRKVSSTGGQLGRWPRAEAVRAGPYAVATFVEAVKALRPTGIIGVSTMPKLFARFVESPFVELR